MEQYTTQYRKGRCVQCGKLLTEHYKFTAEDIEASKGATYHKPIKGWFAPLSPELIGCWQSHEPMHWSY